MSRPLVDGPKYINFQFESRRSCMEYMETITFHDVDRDSRESLEFGGGGVVAGTQTHPI